MKVGRWEAINILSKIRFITVIIILYFLINIMIKFFNVILVIIMEHRDDKLWIINCLTSIIIFLKFRMHVVCGYFRCTDFLYSYVFIGFKLFLGLWVLFHILVCYKVRCTWNMIYVHIHIHTAVYNIYTLLLWVQTCVSEVNSYSVFFTKICWSRSIIIIQLFRSRRVTRSELPVRYIPLSLFSFAVDFVFSIVFRDLYRHNSARFEYHFFDFRPLRLRQRLTYYTYMCVRTY